MQNKNKLIQKSLNPERRLATFIALEPQYEDNLTSDLHSDWYDEDTVLEACLDFNKSMNIRKGNLYHMINTEGYSFVESYVTPAEMIIGEQVIRKGTWLITILATADWIWEGIKNGTFDSLSVDCMGTVEDIDE